MSQTALDTIMTGEVAGGVTAARLPDVPCNMVKIKAAISNSGNVYLGGSNVSLPTGSTNQTAGIELDAGQETGWMPLSNLNKLWRICDNAGDDLIYIALL